MKLPNILIGLAALVVSLVMIAHPELCAPFLDAIIHPIFSRAGLLQ